MDILLTILALIYVGGIVITVFITTFTVGVFTNRSVPWTIYGLAFLFGLVWFLYWPWRWIKDHQIDRSTNDDYPILDIDDPADYH